MKPPMHADERGSFPSAFIGGSCLGGMRLPTYVERASLLPPRQNSKSEARNPKQCQMSQIQNSKRASLQAVHFRDLEIRILNLFRISIFELRISKGKLDRFVNLVVTKKP